MRAGRRKRGKRCSSVCGGGMDANALIDTGAILALLDRTDRWHRVCVDAFQRLRLPLLTSEAVLTELFHLVGDSRKEVEAAWKFVRSGALQLGAIEHSEIPQLHALMSRYADRPMAFADATLVHLRNASLCRPSLPWIMRISIRIGSRAGGEVPRPARQPPVGTQADRDHSRTRKRHQDQRRSRSMARNADLITADRASPAAWIEGGISQGSRGGLHHRSRGAAHPQLNLLTGETRN